MKQKKESAKKKQERRKREKNDFVVFCFSMAIHFPVRVRVLVVPVRIVSGVGVGKDRKWFVLWVCVPVTVKVPLPVRKLARAA